MKAEPTYEFTDAVTSDLSFVARGETPEAAFGAAAEALLATTVDDPQSVEPRLRRRIALEEPDLDLLLLRFLNELVYLRDAEGLVLRADHLRVQANRPVRLEAELAGEPFSPERHGHATEVKAATAHGLRVARTPRGWEASVTLDV